VKLAIIGAGSGYMPGIIRGLLHRAADLAGTEIACHDIDADHLELMAGLARRMFAARGTAAKADFTVTAHIDLKAALDGASYVFTTFRPGGMAARHQDA
jgi:6-phospho-beta-glucosidase